MFFFFWVRGTLLRFRYDQFMNIGWKILIPTALVWLVAVIGVQSVRQFAEVDLRQMLIWIGIPLAVLLLALVFWPEKKKPEPVAAGPVVFDPMADGFPVPPLPGQQLPPAPRRRTVSAGSVVAGATAGPETKETGDE
ncbi:NADH-quinone oxidoreductase subunit H, partial [Cutibacterium acnes]